MSRVFILIFLVAFIATSSFAQKKKKPTKEERMAIREEWYEGSIMTAEQEELKGLVWYNDTNGVLSFMDGTNSRGFTANSAVSFEFFDESLQKQRLYYSIEYDDPDLYGGKRLYFFEVLREFKDFAVLTKTNPVEVQQGGGGGTMSSGGHISPGGPTYTRVSQTETVYFLNSDGKLEPYLTVTKTKISEQISLDDSKGKNRLVDHSLFAEYITSPVYDKLATFARENDLKFHNKEDFLVILNHYAENYAE